MRKTLVSVFALAFALTGSVASAQAYYPVYNASSAGCVALSSDLSVGSRGADVTSLQRFLVAQNYQGGGSWMVTGYFGAATQAALRNYQSQHLLPMTGMADAATRAAIAANCGGAYNLYPAPSYPSTPVYPTYPTTPVYPSYPTPTYPQYPYQGTVSITSLTTNSATPSTRVTIYGSGFQYGNSIVHIGSENVAVTSSGTNSLTFIVPNIAPGSYQLYVTTSYGTSNALPFSVIPAYPCSPFGSCNGCNNNYGYNFGIYGTNFGLGSCPGGPLTLSFLSPNSGAVGTSVTVYGSGFSSNGNSVRFGNGLITNLHSFDGTTLTFSVPDQLTGYGSGQVVLGTYNVSVSNATGNVSNSLPFTVTSLASAGKPSITGISGPSSLQVGTTGTWTVTLNTQAPAGVNTSVSVNWGDSNTAYANASAPQTFYGTGAQTLTFTHSYSNAGTYTVTFTASNQNGQQSVASATVVVGGTYGNTSISYITPQSGRVGTQVLIVGAGFLQLENTIHFGVGGMLHAVSTNGTSMYYTIPAYVSQCDVMPNTQCFAAQAVMPGTYQIYVSNQNGTTNSVPFTVTL